MNSKEIEILKKEHKLLLKAVKFYANPNNWVDKHDRYNKVKITKKDRMAVDLKIPQTSKGGAMAYRALYFINNDLTEKGYEF